MNYRKWIYIGTPLTPNELNPPEAPFPEFHNVYIHPNDFEHWEKTGKFQQIPFRPPDVREHLA